MLAGIRWARLSDVLKAPLLAPLVLVTCAPPSAEVASEPAAAEETLEVGVAVWDDPAVAELYSTLAIAAQLDFEARMGLEPYNSLAYQALINRGSEGADVIRASLERDGQASLLGLLALRELDEESFRSENPDLTAALLVDQLRTSDDFNAWGVPHLGWDMGGKAIVDLGSEAEQPLRGLLEDCRPAPVWGSEEATEAELYGYRVCDYALALLLTIRGVPPQLPMEVAARDSLIALELSP